jgi:hypothetical protein
MINFYTFGKILFAGDRPMKRPLPVQANAHREKYTDHRYE